MNPKSLENLVPFSALPADRRREIARMGGIASGRRRRHLARLRKTARILEQIAAERKEKRANKPEL